MCSAYGNSVFCLAFSVYCLLPTANCTLFTVYCPLRLPTGYDFSIQFFRTKVLQNHSK